MSEQLPRSNSRLENFEANKLAYEKAEFEASLYGEAGATDFSDDAKHRVEEADQYERHLETLGYRGSADVSDHYTNPYMNNLHEEALDMNAAHDAESAAATAAEQARLDELMNSDVHVRQMKMIAQDIARVSSAEFTADNEARLSAQLSDKQDRLQDLLVKFSEQTTHNPADTQAVIDHIIDMTETTSETTAPVEAATPEQAAERSLLPNYTAEEVASRLEAVRRVRAESETEQASEQQPESAAEADAEVAEDAPLSTEGIEDITPEQAAEAQAEEGESQAEYEARNGVEADDEPLSVEGIEDIEVETDEESEEQSEELSRWRRIGSRFTPTNVAARASALLHTMKRNRNSNETAGEAEDTEESREGMKRKTKVLIGLGILTTAAAVVVANRYGVDFIPGNASTGDANEAVRNQGSGNRNAGGNGINWNDFDPSARRIHDGEGFFSTFKQMGIPKENWGEILKDAGPKLGEMGEAYYDNSASEWRISHEGVFSNDALQEIAKSARSNGVNLR